MFPGLVDRKEYIAAQQVIMVDQSRVATTRLGERGIRCACDAAVLRADRHADLVVSFREIAQRRYRRGLVRTVVDKNPFPVAVELVF